MKRVVIWRTAMLSGSETFVRNHGRYLTRWEPRYLGATRVESPLSDPGQDTVAFPDGGFLPLRLTGRSARLRAVLRDLRPDVVHAHFGGDGYLISDAASHVPLVVTVHGHDVTRQPAAPGLRGLRHRHHLRRVFDRAAVILAVSAHLRDRAVHWGADPAKVRVHHTGVPLDTPAPAPRADWDVVFVGRLVEKKGAGDLITALAALPRVRALIIGSGPLEERLRERAPHVTFLGAQPPAVVTEQLSRAKVIAVPSRTAADGDAEGLPTALLEAAALGVPAVATRHSGIPEAVVHGRTGLLSPEADPDALADHLRLMLADDQARARMGKAAREHAETHFDLRRQSALLEDLYDTLAG